MLFPCNSPSCLNGRRPGSGVTAGGDCTEPSGKTQGQLKHCREPCDAGKQEGAGPLPVKRGRGQIGDRGSQFGDRRSRAADTSHGSVFGWQLSRFPHWKRIACRSYCVRSAIANGGSLAQGPSPGEQASRGRIGLHRTTVVWGNPGRHVRHRQWHSENRMTWSLRFGEIYICISLSQLSRFDAVCKAEN